MRNTALAAWLVRAVTTGVWGNPAFVTDSSGFGWKYDNTSGELWVNSALVDMSNNSYTIYGYQ